jgi:outer membrane biosynthesis protein TonB
MYLAGILELWMLLAVSLWAQGSSARVLVFPDALRQQPSGSSSQAPANQNQPTAQDAPKSDSQSAAPSGQNQNTQPTQESKPAESQTGQTTPPKTEKPPAKTKPKQKKPAPASKDTAKEASKDASGKKTVVHHGSTSDPIVQLTPGMTQEQAEKQRQRIQQALATTDANLQKLSGIQLTSDKQEIVAQVRKFMEQSRDAKETGDLQRAENLALKAQLLSSDLVKQ